MNRLLNLILCLSMLLGLSTPSFGAGLTLRYAFKAGQQWECTRMSHISFRVMGQQHTKKDRDTIVYTVSKGPKPDWVCLTARYTTPADVSDANPIAAAKYDLIFSADVHLSGDTRNVAVSGMQARLQDPALDPQVKTALKQTYDILEDSLPAAVFWFPELPEESLQPGDEFEDKRTHRSKSQYMQSKTKSRQSFVLEEVSQGLAYFSSRTRHATTMSTMGSKTDQKMSGKGETIFDLDAGMWVEMTTKSKMTISGAMMGSDTDQEMVIAEKIRMRQL